MYCRCLTICRAPRKKHPCLLRLQLAFAHILEIPGILEAWQCSRGVTCLNSISEIGSPLDMSKHSMGPCWPAESYSSHCIILHREHMGIIQSCVPRPTRQASALGIMMAVLQNRPMVITQYLASCSDGQDVEQQFKTRLLTSLARKKCIVFFLQRLTGTREID